MRLRLATVPALSSVPGLVHGFGQRAGPEPETREETIARARAALADAGPLLLLRQVHGTSVATAPWRRSPEADAALATAPGLLLGIATADCLPVLLVDPVRRAVAAAHAGWRGTAGRIAVHAVEALLAAGSRPGDLLAALGPGIGPCCYEVGPEVRTAFGPDGERFFRPGPRGRPHLDVPGANARQLEESGLRPERVHRVGHCTSCRGDLYHSYRRDGAGTGRMISFVGLRE
jgi:YfiH family protein